MTPGERIAAALVGVYDVALGREEVASIGRLVDVEVASAIEADRRASIRALQRVRVAARSWPESVSASGILDKAIDVLRARSRKGKAAKR